ncbi:hypothetical protein PK28_14580 [Hymenobacter sp. DG25B]|uniref:hypothetical protein n=1 Tax=Hymenobacter sp. DG25B TaxID=1385664 RepID=UPI0005409278|nr:hypothetical protein [Hymenobacter sp. DG25B]AIZ64593.1 hypothetical protein PK28_14580 [Hymenobacter sp. DG25B]
MESFKSLLLGITLTGTLLAGCKEEKAAPAQDYVVFGWYHNECQGESCIEIFKIDTQSAQLYEDTQDKNPAGTTPYEGTYVIKSQAQYNQVQTLPQQLPAQLLTQPSGLVIGSPDFADGGGYYVEVSTKGERKFWLIDRQKGNLPTYLHAFADELDAKITSLQ